MHYRDNKSTDFVDIKFGNIPLNRVTYTTFLGIWIDDMLNWKKHCEIVQKKITKWIICT